MPDLYDLSTVAHVGGLEPYYLHNLGHAPWVGSVYRTDTAFHNVNLRVYYRLSVAHELSGVYCVSFIRKKTYRHLATGSPVYRA